MLSASGGLRPLWPGALPLDPAGGSAARPRTRQLNFVPVPQTESRCLWSASRVIRQTLRISNAEYITHMLRTQFASQWKYRRLSISDYHECKPLPWDAAYHITDVPSSVCLLDTTMSTTKMGKPVETPFGVWTRVGPRNADLSILGEHVPAHWEVWGLLGGSTDAGIRCLSILQ